MKQIVFIFIALSINLSLIISCVVNDFFVFYVNDVSRDHSFEVEVPFIPHHVELKISGKLDGSGKVSLYDSTSGYSYDAFFRAGKVDTLLEGDWYAHQNSLSFTPGSATQGNLEIKIKLYKAADL